MDTIKSPYLDAESLELEVVDEENEAFTKQLNSPFLTHDFSAKGDLNELEHFDEGRSEDEFEEEWQEIQNIEDEDEFYEEGESPFEEISIEQQPDVVDFIPDIAAIFHNWRKKAKKNVEYGKRLGWAKYSTQIGQLLLKSTGQSNIDHTSVHFAMLVAQWQAQNGFKGKDVDGIIGPNTWEKIKPQLGASLPVPKPSKPTIYEIYDILSKKILQSNHKFAVRLMDMLNRLRRGGESGDDRVIQWNRIAPPKWRTRDDYRRTTPTYMPLREKFDKGPTDVWIHKNLKSISDVDRQPVIRGFKDPSRFVTSIKLDLKSVPWESKREDYENLLWFTFERIHKFADQSYVWLEIWANETMLWSDSNMDVGYKAIHEWLQAQAHKKTSPLYSIRTIKGSWWQQETIMGQSSEVFEEEQNQDDFGNSYESSESNYKDENYEREKSNYQDEYIPGDNGAEEVLYNEVIDDKVQDDFLDFTYEENEALQDLGNKGLSSIAIQAEKQWDASKDRPSKWIGKVHGLVVHTTGGSLPGRAITNNIYPTQQAINWYTRGRKKKSFHGGCHYINGWQGYGGGDLIQIANEREKAWGVSTTKQRKSINNKRFEKDLPEELVKHWKKRWPNFADPLDLLPGKEYPNNCYIHVECTPVYYFINKKAIVSKEYPPMRVGLRFTKAQHDTIAYLACDIAIRNGWPLNEEWWRTSRLVGHEDLSPITRKDKREGWDPGALRDKPYFDWDYVYNKIIEIKNSGYKLPGQNPISNTSGFIQDTIKKGRSVVGNLFDRGQLISVALAAISQGESDTNKITNMLFFAKYPSKDGQKLKSNDPLAKDWLSIRKNIVRPLLKMKLEK